MRHEELRGAVHHTANLGEYIAGSRNSRHCTSCLSKVSVEEGGGRGGESVLVALRKRKGSGAGRLPERTLFRDKLDPFVVMERQERLQQYMNEVLDCVDPRQCKALSMFLGFGDITGAFSLTQTAAAVGAKEGGGGGALRPSASSQRKHCIKSRTNKMRLISLKEARREFRML